MRITKAMENRLAKVAMDCRNAIVHVNDSRTELSVIGVNSNYVRRYYLFSYKSAKQMEDKVEKDCIYSV